MYRDPGSQLLVDSVARFDEEINDLAWEIVRAVLAQELSRRKAEAPRAQTAERQRRPRVRARKAIVAAPPVTPSPADQPLTDAAAPATTASAGAGTADSAANLAAPDGAGANGANGSNGASTAAPPNGAGAIAAGADPAAAAKPAGRLKWTRERVVAELAQWLLEVPSLDASFLTRRGQAQLVAAARRIFGRFDAALNVANLHLAALYPDGPPKRSRPATLAA